MRVADRAWFQLLTVGLFAAFVLTGLVLPLVERRHETERRLHQVEAELGELQRSLAAVKLLLAADRGSGVDGQGDQRGDDGRN